MVSFRDWTYDAAGRMSQVRETVTANNSVSTYISSQDGDGQSTIEYYQENLASKSFMVRSSVLGGKVLTRLDNAGNKSSTVFDVDGLLTAVQNVSSYGSSVRWTHIDPLGLSEAGDTKAVFDPMGNYIVWQHAPTGPPPNAYPPIAASFGGLGPSFGYAINSSCILDGIPTDCGLALNMLEQGSAEQCPNNYCGAGRARNGDLVPLTRDPDTGLLGYYSSPPQKSSPPQDPAQQQTNQKSKGRKGTTECASIRAVLLGNSRIKAVLDDTWNRSVQGSHEEQGGLLGEGIDYGLPNKNIWVAEPFYRLGGASTSLKGFTDWAVNQIKSDKERVVYHFWYHTHPFEKNEYVPGVGTAGDPNLPSGELYDLHTSAETGLLGIIVSRTNIVVFDKDGVIRCSFAR